MYTAHGSVLTDQFGFKLVLAVSMAQSPVATFSPGKQFSTGGNAGAVCSSGGNVHHFHSPQGLNYTRTVTGTKDEMVNGEWTVFI